MNRNYTEAAKERCLSLLDTEIDHIWDDIGNTPKDTDAEKWAKKFAAIAAEYTLSSRFALMRIFQRQAVAEQDIARDNHTGFEVRFRDGSVGVFGDISMEYAANMEQEELDLYEKLMMERASNRARADADDKSDLKLIQKALQNHQKRTTLLTKAEAMDLGHRIGLTLQEMEWFLLRVFHVDGGFRYNSSEDLIDAYVFLRDENGKTGASAAALKSAYNARYGSLDKRPHEENPDWTQGNGSSLPGKVSTWSPDECDERFMEWIGARAEHLDLPSATALRIYRNLAAFAYKHKKGGAPDVDTLRERGETDFYHCIMEIVSAKEYAAQTVGALFDGGNLSEEKKWKTLASSLLLENMDLSFSDETDETNAWHVIDFRTDGGVTVNGGINASRTRVQELLLGDLQVEKGDLLYLLWFAANLCWSQGNEHPDANALSTRLFDFIDLAENCLNMAGLPPFYPPHPLEQSMMLSIIYAYSATEGSALAEGYELICSALISRRKGGSHAGKHTEEEKRASVNDLMESGMTVKEFAKMLGIGYSTLPAEVYEQICSALISRRKVGSHAKRRTEEEKRAIVNDLMESGMTQREYAKKFGIGYSTLSAWKSKFRKEEG